MVSVFELRSSNEIHTTLHFRGDIGLWLNTRAVFPRQLPHLSTPLRKLPLPIASQVVVPSWNTEVLSICATPPTSSCFLSMITECRHPPRARPQISVLCPSPAPPNVAFPESWCCECESARGTWLYNRGWRERDRPRAACGMGVVKSELATLWLSSAAQCRDASNCGRSTV